MKVIFLEKFSKDLDKIKDQNAHESIKNAILKVEKAPSLQKITGLKRLTGEKGAFRLRVGNYRVGLYIQGDTVEMARVAHRKDIYDIFPKKIPMGKYLVLKKPNCCKHPDVPVLVFTSPGHRVLSLFHSRTTLRAPAWHLTLLFTLRCVMAM